MVAELLYAVLRCGGYTLGLLHTLIVSIKIVVGRSLVHQLFGSITIVLGSVHVVERLGRPHFEGRPMNVGGGKQVRAIDIAVNMYMLWIVLVEIIVFAVFLQLPGIHTVEIAVHIHNSGESVGGAAGIGIGLGYLGSVPRSLTAASDNHIVYLVADGACTAEFIQIVGFNVEGILFHPVTDFDVRGLVAYPLILAEIKCIVFLGPGCGTFALQINQDTLLEVIALTVVELHPRMIVGGLSWREVVDAADIDIGTSRHSDIDFFLVAQVGEVVRVESQPCNVLLKLARTFILGYRSIAECQ